MEDSERRVTHVIASESQEAPDRQRNHMQKTKTNTLPGRRKRKKVFLSQVRSEMQSKIEGFSKVTHEQEVQQEQSVENMRTIDAQLRVRLHSEEQKGGVSNGGSYGNSRW